MTTCIYFDFVLFILILVTMDLCQGSNHANRNHQCFLSIVWLLIGWCGNMRLVKKSWNNVEQWCLNNAFTPLKHMSYEGFNFFDIHQITFKLIQMLDWYFKEHCTHITHIFNNILSFETCKHIKEGLVLLMVVPISMAKPSTMARFYLWNTNFIPRTKSTSLNWNIWDWINVDALAHCKTKLCFIWMFWRIIYRQ